MCLLEFHPVLFFSSQNLQSSSSKASQSSSISFSSLSIESQLLQKIQNGYQRTSWGSFMNFVQMLVQILEFSIFPPWWRSWMDTRGSSWGHHKLMCSNTRPNPPRSFDFWVTTPTAWVRALSGLLCAYNFSAHSRQHLKLLCMKWHVIGCTDITWFGSHPNCLSAEHSNCVD